MPDQNIQWHPGFFAGMELELKSYSLEFQSEYQLTRGPLSIDLLIIRKLTEEKIENEIGEFFLRHNILEYKSPDDDLDVDVFYKAQAYAALYKASGEHVDEIPATEVTVSLFRESLPKAMIGKLEQLGATIRKRRPGIYEIHGVCLFPTQIITTGELDLQGHAGLRVLSRKARREEIEAFLTASEKMKSPGDLARIDAILQVSATANSELYRKVYEEGGPMCQVLHEIMKEDFQKAEDRARADGEGKLSSLIQKLMDLNRLDDVYKVTADAEYRKKLYQEMNIA